MLVPPFGSKETRKTDSASTKWTGSFVRVSNTSLAIGMRVVVDTVLACGRAGVPDAKLHKLEGISSPATIHSLTTALKHIAFDLIFIGLSFLCLPSLVSQLTLPSLISDGVAPTKPPSTSFPTLRLQPNLRSDQGSGDGITCGDHRAHLL